MCLNTEAADHEVQIDKFLKLGSLQHEKKNLPTIAYKLMHLKFKQQRLGLCPEKTQSHTEKKSGQGFLPPAYFVSTQAKQGAYLSHRSAYEICRGCVFLSDS